MSFLSSRNPGGGVRLLTHLSEWKGIPKTLTWYLSFHVLSCLLQLPGTCKPKEDTNLSFGSPHIHRTSRTPPGRKPKGTITTSTQPHLSN
ncbi:hypothetical protein CHARACLAT_008441 [Characodon lateralis]|uniref:Uncharacterized protein n=1 Tax=Characodon lateralis TaxID=208331 RepID=A0ABU7D711_9TELE|nr:hypothetical protein [Characodon lateralis]